MYPSLTIAAQNVQIWYIVSIVGSVLGLGMLWLEFAECSRATIAQEHK